MQNPGRVVACLTGALPREVVVAYNPRSASARRLREAFNLVGLGFACPKNSGT